MILSLALGGPVLAAQPPAPPDEPLKVDPLPPAAPPAPAPTGTVFTLDQAVAKALAMQPSLRQARANTDAAQGRVEQARSFYLPQVAGSAAYQRQTGNFTPRPGTSTTLATPPSWSARSYNFFNFGLNGSQLIFDFGQTTGRTHAAVASREAFKATEQTTELQVIFGVRRAYFQALAQEELVRVANENLANQKKHLNQIEGLVKAGIRPDIDLAQARTDLANARVTLITAQNGIANARATLDQTLGAPIPEGYRLVNEPPPPVQGEEGSTDRLLETALATRPELVSLARSRQAQEQTVRALQGGYGPSIAATGSVTEAGTQIDHLAPNWVVGATLTWPILQGGLTRGQVHEAKANLDSLVAQDQAMRLQVRVDVEQAALSVRATRAEGIAAQDAEVSAREQLRLAEGRYSAGLGSVIELGDAQVAHTNAAAQEVQARYNLAIARAQLLAALGKR